MIEKKLPYRYLNITDNPLVPDWKKFVSNFSETFYYKDFGGNYLRKEVKELFLDLGLIPLRGNLWSRPPFCIPNYHTDQKDNCEKFAINWLLIGEPGITEWSYSAFNHKIEEINITPLFSSISPQFWGFLDTPPDVVSILNKPMMIQTDIPHRVNTQNVSHWRISYSLRFKNNPSWEEGLKKLRKYIIK